MDIKRKRLDTTRDERVYKKVLPYSVTECNKGGAAAYNALVEKASISKRIATRQRTIDAWTQVQANRQEARIKHLRAEKEAATLAYQNAIYTSKPSIFTRIYNYLFNFFVTINF